MALLREVHPGEVGLADRTKPAERRPPRSVLFATDGTPLADVPVGAIARRLAEGGGFFFADLHAPSDTELDSLQREFYFHPLAIEDVRTRHQRPKIDIYGEQYFLVFYRIGGDGENVLLQEIDFFIGTNFLVVTHDSAVALLDAVYERFCRKDGKKDAAALLYEILDAIVDEYFPFLDDVAERASEIEEAVFQRFDAKTLENVLDLKRDLALFRRIVAPERDTINVLLRRDPPVLDSARVFYFQDVFDHLVRVTDSIDTYRELLTGSLDAFLSVQNNRLSEVVRRLTVISVVFLPLTFLTGFFGMNFRIFDKANQTLFHVAVSLMLVVPAFMLWLLRRRVLE